MDLTLAIPARKMFNLPDFITMKRLENMGKVMLASGLIVFYSYAMEAFFAFYSGNGFERYMWINRVTGPYWKMYAMLIVCNGFAPQLMWFRRIRTSTFGLFVTAMFVNVGMWLELYMYGGLLRLLQRERFRALH